MIRAIFFAFCLFLSSPTLGQTAQERVVPPVKVQLDAVPTGALVSMLMRDVLRVPYVIAPDVLSDSKPMSVNLVMPRQDIHVLVVGFLRASGFYVQLRDGTLFVSKKRIAGLPDPMVYGATQIPTGSPLSPPQSVSVAPAPLGYDGGGVPVPSIGPLSEVQAAPVLAKAVSLVVPAHRAVDELGQMLEAVFPDMVFARRAGSAPDDGRIVDRLEPDTLVMTGTDSDIARAELLVRQLDRPRPVVEIRSVIFEVRDSRTRNSALSLLASLLGDRVQVGSTPGYAPGDQFVRIAVGGLQAVLSATRGDGRFHVVAEPTLAATSGTVAKINSGSQVPTLGAVSFLESGDTVRSVEYRDSGVSLTVRPVVRGGEIELAVEQERSNFVNTTTGVNDSPTLNKATASARVSIRPGESLVLAGLDQTADQERKEGFFGGLIGSRTSSKESSQLLVVVQADLSPSVGQGETVIYRLPDPVDEELPA